MREGRPTDYIELKAPGLPAYMGFASHERVEPQPINLSAKLYFDTTYSAGTGELSDAVDYVKILGESRFILWASRFFLIETAAETLCRYYLRAERDGRRSPVAAVELRLEKPRALKEVAVPALTIFRTSEDYQANLPEKNGQLIVENRDCRIRRIDIMPQASFSIKDANVSVMTMGSGFVLGESKLAEGTVKHHKASDGVEYLNKNDALQSLLCVECRDGDWNVGAIANYPPNQRETFYESVISDYIDRKGN